MERREIIGISILCKNNNNKYDDLIRLSKSRISYTRVFKDLTEETVASTRTTISEYENEFFEVLHSVKKEFANENECKMKENFDFNIRLIFNNGTKLDKSYNNDFAENNLSELGRQIRQICRFIEYCPIRINEYKARTLNKAALEKICKSELLAIRVECGGTLDWGGRVDIVSEDTVYSDNLFYNNEADLTQAEALKAFKVPNNLLNNAFYKGVATFKRKGINYYCYHIGQCRYLIFNMYFAYTHNLSLTDRSMPMLRLWRYWEYLMGREADSVKKCKC